MKIKIAFCIVVLLILSVCKPNLQFMQKTEVKKSQKVAIKNNVNLSIYRKNPEKYFSLLKEKQKGIENLYMSYYMGDSNSDILDEVYLKKGLSRFTNYVKVNGIFVEAMTILKRGKKTYAFRMNPVTSSNFALDMSNKSLLGEGFSFFPADIVPQKELNIYKFIGTRKYKGRVCSIWQNMKHNKHTGVLFTNNLCVDEELGLILYQNSYNNSTYDTFTLLTTKEISTDVIKDEEFYIPKYIKSIVNGKFAVFLGTLLSKDMEKMLYQK